MSLVKVKVFRPIIVALGIFVVLLLLASQCLGPGVSDFSEPIVNGYEYNDAGWYEKAIVYRGSERTRQIIVDARVDDYRLDGNKLLVARRPRVSKLAKDGALDSFLLPDCEYWTINVKDHRVEKTPDAGGLRCK